MQRIKRYCGRKSDIKCNCCNGICGPTNGCQCSNCRKNDSKKSQENGKYYCGNKNDIPCLCCDGFCGPDNGHQCSACRQKQAEENPGYCGKKSDFNCNCCDGWCGPTNGCPCISCRKKYSKISYETNLYYCGYKSDIPCLCCNGYCGPTNGHQCSACKQKQLEQQKTIYQQINIGMNKGKVQIGQKGSLKFVSKQLKNLIQVKNYEILAKLDIGVNILETIGCTIKMEYGQPLDQIINQLNQYQKQIVLYQLKNIQKTLIQNQLAHTDIKPANIVIIFNGSSIQTKLIDADYLVAFGQNRQVCTFGQNVTSLKPIDEICQAANERTDSNGFERIYKLLS